MIERQIYVRCHICGARWAEHIPSIQPARLPLPISSIRCDCGADFSKINLATPAPERSNVKQA